MTEETPTDPIIFRTGTATKIGDTFVAVVYALGAMIFVPAGAVFAWAIVLIIGGPQWLCILAGFVASLFLVRLGWNTVIEQIRFYIVLHPKFLQIGEDISRVDLDYEAIDEVSLTNNDTDGVGIGLSASGRDLCVRLPATQAVQCFEALLPRCPNAIFSDTSGREYVTPNEEQPEKTLLVIEKHKRKVGVRCLAALPFMLLWALFHLFMVFQWLTGAIQVAPVAVPEMFIFAALSILSTLACLSWAGTAFSKSQEARCQRLQILEADDTPSP